jgi:hypothetical protein
MLRGRSWQQRWWLDQVERCRPLPVWVAEEVFGFDRSRLLLPDGSPLLVPRRALPMVGANSPGYSAGTEGAVALGAGTAKTIMGIKAGTTFILDWRGYRVAFDGVTASAVPALIEPATCTFATNAPGTASTSTTVKNPYGRQVASGMTSAKTWTTEPTVVTAVDEFLLTPNAGLVIYDWPLGESPDTGLGEGVGVRVTAPAIVNVRGSMDVERA